MHDLITLIQLLAFGVNVRIRDNTTGIEIAGKTGEKLNRNLKNLIIDYHMVNAYVTRITPLHSAQELYIECNTR